MFPKYYKQFVAFTSSIRPDIPEDFKSTEIGELSIAFQPDLEFYAAASTDVTVVMLGFALHPINAHWSDQEIVNHLSKLDEQSFLEELSILNGTYRIFRAEGKNVSIYHDAATSGKIFYKFLENKLIVGSDQRILEDVFKLKKDDSEIALKFYNSDFFKNRETWFGNLTPYKDLFQLLPNYKICSDLGKVIRYFPLYPLQKKELKEVASQSKKIIEGYYQAAANRFDLKVSMTAGWDSRILLAASKPYVNNAQYYTFLRYNINETHFDVVTAQQMAKDFGLDHFLLPDEMVHQKEIEEWMRQNLALLSTERCRHMMDLKDRGTGNPIAVLGTLSEVVKNYLENVPVHTGKELVAALHFPAFEYLEEYFQSWLEENREYLQKLGYSFMDFAHWEQDITNFAGQGLCYHNLVLPAFTPFNSRMLLNTMLSVNAKYRDQHYNELYVEIIKEMWPDLLAYPINPGRKAKLIALAKKIGIYHFYKRLSTKPKKARS